MIFLFTKQHLAYVPYLAKTPQEHGLIAAGCKPNLAILGDSVYISPSNETPGLCWIAIQKDSLIAPNEQATMHELIPIPISMF